MLAPHINFIAGMHNGRLTEGSSSKALPLHCHVLLILHALLLSNNLEPPK